VVVAKVEILFTTLIKFCITAECQKLRTAYRYVFFPMVHKVEFLSYMHPICHDSRRCLNVF